MKASGYDRVHNDWYREPRWLVDALLDVEPLEGFSWDPSCGAGNIPLALHARDMPCMGSDLADRGFGLTGLDFFKATDTADNIITNPPYNVIEIYIRHALSLTTRKVCILARLALLEGIKRQEMFRTTPLARVWVSSRRASMPPGGTNIEAKGGTVAYGWFVWEHGFVGKPTIGWL